MFNVPIPDGTTAHAVGGVLIAVLLGPWAAVIAVSIALLIQALFFGDGGVLAYGANCFNMALVMPVVGYAVYRAVARRVSLTSPRRALAAGLGGYIGLNVAALCAAVEFGLQPVLFKAADGAPLYAPFHLSQTIPAMALAHLTVAGGVEFVMTFGVIAYLQRANLPIMRINHGAVAETDAELAPTRKMGWRWALVESEVSWVIKKPGQLGGLPDLKKPTALRGAVGVWNRESGDRIKGCDGTCIRVVLLPRRSGQLEHNQSRSLLICSTRFPQVAVPSCCSSLQRSAILF
jgi:cobalamin biosynthesis protein CbiM